MKKLDLRWLRLGAGSVRHLCVPLSGYDWRAFCGRQGHAFMTPFYVEAAGKTIYPAEMRECQECLGVVGDVIPAHIVFERKK